MVLVCKKLHLTFVVYSVMIIMWKGMVVMMVLNETQIQRLYNLFDFEDYEEIVSATMVGKKLKVHYVDNIDGIVGCYEPRLEPWQIKFIRKGLVLQRN